MVIFAPYNADGVGVFDPSDNSFVLVDIASTITTDKKFGAAATASIGKVIFMPSAADGLGIFEVTNFVCNASTAPTNGGLGNCTDTLESGSTCQPTCDAGYTLFGERSCVEGTYVDTAACVIPPPPPLPAATFPAISSAAAGASPAGAQAPPRR